MEAEPVVARGNPGVPGQQGGGGDGVAATATDRAVARASADGVGTVVLVEGVSDAVAVEALAERQGRDLAAEGVVVVPMGGATSIGRFLDRFGPAGAGLRLAGLCDAREEGAVRGALERAGVEVRSFHVCQVDLEDELIRTLGVDAVERIIESDGEGRSLRTFRRQRTQLDRPLDEQLRRFLGTRAGGKARYARLLVEGLDLDHLPPPLARLLADL
jgi:hypothetical protein